RVARDQTIYVVRIISIYVTFYKAVIPASYLIELGEGLPQEQSVVSVVILRWPGENIPEAGLNIAEPERRRELSLKHCVACFIQCVLFLKFFIWLKMRFADAVGSVFFNVQK
ncbi:hypothetical protein RhiirA4_397730, partial [Rhizophagus irregularis]